MQARTRGAPASAAGALQSICWGASAAGGVATALASGSLVQSWGPRPVFLLTACLPLLVSCVAPLVRDTPPSSADGATSGGGGKDASSQDEQYKPPPVAAQVARLWAVARQRAVWAPAAFLFAWQAAPSPDAALFLFTTSKLGFTASFLGKARLAGALASLAGVALYNSKLKHVPIPIIFRWTQLAGAALGCTQLLLVTGINRKLGAYQPMHIPFWGHSQSYKTYIYIYIFFLIFLLQGFPMRRSRCPTPSSSACWARSRSCRRWFWPRGCARKAWRRPSSPPS